MNYSSNFFFFFFFYIIPRVDDIRETTENVEKVVDHVVSHDFESSDMFSL